MKAGTKQQVRRGCRMLSFVASRRQAITFSESTSSRLPIFCVSVISIYCNETGCGEYIAGVVAWSARAPWRRTQERNQPTRYDVTWLIVMNRKLLVVAMETGKLHGDAAGGDVTRRAISLTSGFPVCLTYITV